MPNYKQVNKATNVISVGRTAPVPRGQQPKEKSLPVVLASDAPPVPVAEQNKVQSEVALSLLGIPRAEVALGIFADVNTYDVNPSEWSIQPVDKRQFSGAQATASGIRPFTYEGYASAQYNWGLTHVPEEAGALIEAPPGQTSTLTSKRFFRYQPGRVSAATFGVKCSASKTAANSEDEGLPLKSTRNPAIRKFGIYDKFDGYYWETRDTGKGDQFGVTRRTQSIIDFRFHHKEFTSNGAITNNQLTDYGIVGKGKEVTEVRESIMNSPRASINAAGQITIHQVYRNGATTSALSKHFKDGVIPQVGMTVKNITIALTDTGDSPALPFLNGTADRVGYLADTDESPLFRESTVVTAVEKSGDDLKITLNQPAIKGAIYDVTGAFGAKNPTTADQTTGAQTQNGRDESPFGDSNNNGGHKKRLKFSFAGENLLVRDNLPLVQAGIYDPSLLKPAKEYLVKALDTNNHTIQFPLPVSAAGLTNRDLIDKGMVKYDDSPAGLYVANVFSFGQIIEYTTDATSYDNAAGSSYIPSSSASYDNARNIWFIDEVDAYNNKIRVKNISRAYGQTTNHSPENIAWNTSASTHNDTKHYIKTSVPFMFPETYISGNENVHDTMFPYARDFQVFSGDSTKPQLKTTGNTQRGAGGSFGLLETDLTKGDTSSNLQPEQFETYKAEINDINSGLSCCDMRGGRMYGPTDLYTVNSTQKFNGENVPTERHRKSSGWRYWIENNVDPEYWGVYEYKVPRSRFSFDSLNGNPGESVVYSDVVRDAGKPRYPGQVTAAKENTRDSVWDIDFGNVIMKKIEFSWYGAVGALFLAYVPTGTGEARWVRVHHLRCSNQLKTASLGNATLPLTYTIFGGGTPKQLGRDAINTAGYNSGKSSSEFITKYGSSYYIDGGDRGTVRLFNYAQPAASKISTSKFSDEIIEPGTTTIIGTNAAQFRINSIHDREDLYFGATVSFKDNPQTARVTHIERQGIFGTSNRALGNSLNGNEKNVSPNIFTVFLDRTMTIDSPVNFLIDAPYSIFGITSKESIQSSQEFLVRNRVQVYPTKLSVGMQTPGGQKKTTGLSLTKNVIFQDNAVYKAYANDADKKHKTVLFKDVNQTGTALQLAGSGLPTRLTHANVSPTVKDSSVLTATDTTNAGPYYDNAVIGDKIYGWARVTDGTTPFTLFGRIEVVDLGPTMNSPVWDFIPSDSYTGTVSFVENSTFTHAYQYYNDLAPTIKVPGGAAAKNKQTNVSGKYGRISASDAASYISDTQEIERLSSVKVDNEIRRPIPGTGSKVASFFLKDGSDYFDLQPYFDYNKDYISFPLTNIPDNLFIGGIVQDDLSPTGQHALSASPRVAVSLTWEEQ